MDLLVLLALALLSYIAWMIYNTFRSMDAQLRELKYTCGSVASPEQRTSTFKGDVVVDRESPSVTNKLIAGLQKAMLVAS